MYCFLWYFYALILSAFVLSLVTVRRNSPIPYRVLRWWLLVTLPVETTAYLIGHFYHQNHWVYNIWGPIESAMILLVFYKGTVHRVTRRVCGWLLALMPLGVFITWLPHFVFFTLNVPQLLFSFFCELIAACIFLIDGLLWGEELSIFRRPLSWMAFGTILYACVFILMHALWDYFLVWPIWLYGIMVVISNTFQYGGVILTFISLRKNNLRLSRITA